MKTAVPTEAYQHKGGTFHPTPIVEYPSAQSLHLDFQDVSTGHFFPLPHVADLLSAIDASLEKWRGSQMNPKRLTLSDFHVVGIDHENGNRSLLFQHRKTLRVQVSDVRLLREPIARNGLPMGCWVICGELSATAVE